VVATYQSVSGAGKDADGRIVPSDASVFVADPIEKAEFTKQIAFT